MKLQAFLIYGDITINAAPATMAIHGCVFWYTIHIQYIKNNTQSCLELKQLQFNTAELQQANHHLKKQKKQITIIHISYLSSNIYSKQQNKGSKNNTSHQMITDKNRIILAQYSKSSLAQKRNPPQKTAFQFSSNINHQKWQIDTISFTIICVLSSWFIRFHQFVVFFHSKKSCRTQHTCNAIFSHYHVKPF